MLEVYKMSAEKKIDPNDIILELKNVKKYFAPHQGFTQALRGKASNPVKAVDNISLQLRRGEIFGLIGESGSGKTTIGKIVMKLHSVTEGDIFFNGENVTNTDKNRTELYRRQVQMIFQDPYASMNPRFKVKDVLEEPLIIHKLRGNHQETEEKIIQALKEVKLNPPEEFMYRYPHMLSGGQRQRIATARTLILNPELIVADEPVSMIDLSTRAEILHMMKDVQRSLGLTYLYITHDLSTACYFTDRIAVMYLGKIIELGEANDVIENPQHPYTKALIAAVPEPDPDRLSQIKTLPISGEIPSPADIPPGCRFHTRCPYAIDACKAGPEPEFVDIGNGHYHACIRAKELQS
ncbi:ABC transporter ATP-binding protein [Treponema phagedenis]|uniref:ABC transporter ATP-binding protein n=2 Tax=Treponema phagedenis TaxID=162 RepID=A0AAE6ISG5_TREPH|nr:ABC transporter ATP-binding protein [Treponema phagedenis]QEJ97522.1 ABC transporter ATP-binding protein [Treponema phagedenis]QEK01664.1 ABC transporter ATP-binding protein [Treponema phagedenis]